MKANADIRESARLKGVFLWQIADYMDLAEATFLKKLRKELDAEQKAQIFRAIEDIAQG